MAADWKASAGVADIFPVRYSVGLDIQDESAWLSVCCSMCRQVIIQAEKDVLGAVHVTRADLLVAVVQAHKCKAATSLYAVRGGRS